MIIDNFSPNSFDWGRIPSEKTIGETGFAIVKWQSMGNIKVRWVEYANNYIADHWCDKGHIVFVISGQLIIEHKDKSIHIIDSGSTYLVGDNTMPHKAKSVNGAIVFIID